MSIDSVQDFSHVEETGKNTTVLKLGRWIYAQNAQSVIQDLVIR